MRWPRGGFHDARDLSRHCISGEQPGARHRYESRVVDHAMNLTRNLGLTLDAHCLKTRLFDEVHLNVVAEKIHR